MRFICIDCGADHSNAFVPLCSECGGLVDVSYDLETTVIHDSGNPYLRFRELLPIRDTELLPQDAAATPIVESELLSDRLDISRVYVKNEAALPTGTTKDRNAAVVLGLLWECGVKNLITSSTGNSGSAYIRELDRYPGMNLVLFTGEDFVERVRVSTNPRLKWYGLRGGSFNDAGRLAREYALKTGGVFEEGFFSFGKREGAKLTFFESVEQIEEPVDWYVQAVSSGLGVYGVYKGAGELEALGIIPRKPRLLCVQQSSCAPMVRAYRRGADNLEPGDIIVDPQGIAQAILNGNPVRSYPYLKRVVDESNGGFTEVDEDAMRSARRLVRETIGVDPCFAAASAFAGVIEARRSGLVAREDRVLINLSGEDRRGNDFSKLQWVDDDWLETVSSELISSRGVLRAN